MTKSATDSPPTNVWRKRCTIVLVLWGLTIVLMSIPEVRGIVSYPLYVHQSDARGEVAYVMADGYAYWERVRAASDLYHMNRVKRILVLEENQPAGFNFVENKLETRLERTIDFLGSCGVPEDAISSVPVNRSTRMGSLSEARGVAEHFPGMRGVVVVTSAPHTRRSLLCFQRSLRSGTKVQVYAASPPRYSAEIDSPIWIEYLKLLFYSFAA